MRGVQHICIEANRLDDVGRAYDLVQEAQCADRALPRPAHDEHNWSRSTCARSSGFDIEFGAGGELLGDDFVQVNSLHSEVWGHKPMLQGWH